MLAIGVTDPDWFFRLRSDGSHDVVNWWTPTPWNLKRLRAGDRYYFLLKAPYRQIAGFGLFEKYENLPASEAWRRFSTANGVADEAELIAKTTGYARRRSTTFNETSDPIIGCISLRSPTFLDDADFFTPEDSGVPFPQEIVKFKYFNRDTLDPADVVNGDVAQIEAGLEELITGRRRGGPRRTAAENRAIERRAVSVAIEHYEAKGWRVEDVGNTHSFDLLCSQPGAELRVEVKGTTSSAKKVALTRAEVSHARYQYPHVDLFVVKEISLTTNGEGQPQAAGGVPVIYERWEIDDRRLTPLAFEYELPHL